jgi:hypothetical protein
MKPEDWVEVATHTVAAFPSGQSWHVLVEDFDDFKKLRITVSVLSRCLGALVSPCGPNGHNGLPFLTTGLTFSELQPGCVVGKLGGSSASSTDGTIFAIGAHCVVPLPEHFAGPVYITINAMLGEPIKLLEPMEVVVKGTHVG